MRIASLPGGNTSSVCRFDDKEIACANLFSETVPKIYFQGNELISLGKAGLIPQSLLVWSESSDWVYGWHESASVNKAVCEGALLRFELPSGSPTEHGFTGPHSPPFPPMPFEEGNILHCQVYRNTAPSYCWSPPFESWWSNASGLADYKKAMNKSNNLMLYKSWVKVKENPAA